MTHAPDEVSHIQPDFDSHKISKPNNNFINGNYTDWVSEQRMVQLRQLKIKYDPINFFNENANIIIPESDTSPDSNSNKI